MKSISFSILLCFGSQIVSAQESFGSRLNYELGLGGEYVLLEDYNETFVFGGTSGNPFDMPINLGWSARGAVIYDALETVSFGAVVNYKTFMVSRFEADIHFDDGMPGGPNYHYDYLRKNSLSFVEVGFRFDYYLDKFVFKNKHERLNHAISLGATYGLGHNKHQYSEYIYGNSEPSYESKNNENFKVINLNAGIKFRVKFNNSIFRAMSINLGFVYSMLGSKNSYDLWGNSKQVKMDFTGYNAALIFELGSKKESN